VRGASSDVDAREALADFRRFPTWMWRNTDMVEFVEWLRGYNPALPGGAPRVGFYGLDLTAAGLARSCEDEVVSQLAELLRHAADKAQRDGRQAEDEVFDPVQNARLVKNAEKYHRTMFLEEVSSWNLPDRHMAETVDALIEHLDRHGGPAKIAVWAHNSHLGDARATRWPSAAS
jgi:erythromycin esterase-like protein